MAIDKAHPYSDSLPLPALLHRVALISRQHMFAYLSQESWFLDAGFRPPTIGVIHHIGNMAPVSQKEVSESIGLDPSDLVGVIDQLENAGLVTRQRDPHDRRRQLLSLTAEGEKRRKKLQKIGMNAMEEVLEPLNEKERETLRTLLARVVKHDRFKESK
jgi:DNA-binding MarR family transcriptional regulator